MKKYLMILSVASLGGLVALGLNKWLNNESTATFEKNYLARYASLNEVGARPDFVEVSELVTPTVVHIKTLIESKPADMNQQMDPFGFFRGLPQMPMGPQSASGSGVIISSDGYIVTNNHVIENASKIKVVLNDKRQYDATLIGRDPNTDMALIRIEEKNLQYAIIGNSDEAKVGQWVLAVGNPFDLTSTVTAGIISAKGRNLNLLKDPNRPESQYSIESFIQTDAAVNPGNSGGALVAADGKLIGINTAIASQTGQYAGYAFAVPSNLMKKIVDDLLKYGEVQRGFIGVQIQDVTAELADKEGLKDVKGVYVNGVTENSAAEEAGIKKGDVIINIDNVNVNTSSELQEQIGKRSPGDKVKVALLRNGNEKVFMVTLRGKDGKTTVSTKEKIETNKFMDSEFESVSREERLKLRIANGVRVKKVGDKSKLKKIGVENGVIITAIDKNPVSTVADVKKALENSNGAVLIEAIRPDGTKGYYALELDNK